MTYSRVRGALDLQAPDGAAVSHSAELVRGDFAPSSALRAPSPQGEKGITQSPYELSLPRRISRASSILAAMT